MAISPEPTIGIDLGTRYAQLAVDVPGRGVHIIPNRWGGKRTPSMVALTRSDFLVGEDAARLALVDPRDVWWDMKRHLGTDWVARTSRKAFTPEELLLPLLRLLREDAEAYLKRFVYSCILAVPACFSFSERGALARAAQQAGFEKIRIVNEPTAAALSIGVGGRFLIIDFGAGTLDLSVVEGECGVFQVLESQGRRDLGGFDLDRRLAEYLCRKIDVSMSRTEDPRGALMLSEAETAKIALSNANYITWQIPAGLLMGERTLEITRRDFESLISATIEEVVRMVEHMWQKYAPEKLLIVGGSGRIPLLRRMLAERVREPEHLRICPEDAVVTGSALYANQGRERLLIDVLSRSLGVMDLDGSVVPLLDRGVPLPAEARKKFTAHGRGNLEVTIVQGEGRVRSLNRVLQTIRIEGVSDGEDVEIFFKVDGGGLLHVETSRNNRRNRQIIALESDESGMISCDLVSEIRVREERLARLSLSFPDNFQQRLQILVTDIRSLKNEAPSLQWEALETLDRMIAEIEQVVA